MRLAAGACFAILSCCPVTRADQECFAVNASRSRVAFVLKDVLHTVKGTFEVEHGSICVDPATAIASGQIVVDARSGNTGNRSRDSRMHKQILESSLYPHIVFAPSHIRGAISPLGQSTLDVDGTFTIHGAAHPLTTAVAVQVSGNQFTAATHFEVPYVKWGMKNPSNFFLRVDDHVEISVELAGNTQPANSR
jgi:polyisoprenoid-binding protein YceI